MRAIAALLLVRCRARIAGLLHRAWHEAPAAPAAVRHGLEIALVPSPLVCRLRQAFTLAQVVFGIEFLLLRHPLVAGLVFMLALLPVLQQRFHRLAAAPAPRRLMLTADGRFHLMDVAGGLQAVSLQTSSLRVGPWLLLTLRGAGAVHRLLLGPDNVPPDALAVLHRRMQLADRGAETVAPGLAAHLAPGPHACFDARERIAQSQPVRRQQPG